MVEEKKTMKAHVAAVTYTTRIFDWLVSTSLLNREIMDCINVDEI